MVPLHVKRVTFFKSPININTPNKKCDRKNRHFSFTFTLIPSVFHIIIVFVIIYSFSFCHCRFHDDYFFFPLSMRYIVMQSRRSSCDLIQYSRISISFEYIYGCILYYVLFVHMYEEHMCRKDPALSLRFSVRLACDTTLIRITLHSHNIFIRVGIHVCRCWTIYRSLGWVV